MRDDKVIDSIQCREATIKTQDGDANARRIFSVSKMARPELGYAQAAPLEILTCCATEGRMDTTISVLVAEDNEDDALIIQRAFKQNGLPRPVHIVHDGSVAIEYLHGDGVYADRVAHAFPNVLILDLKMPRVSGFEVLEWLNEHPDYRVIPSIVWSSSADRRDVKHAFCLGAHAYLCKPTSYERFVAMVGRLLAFWEDCEKPGVDPSDPTCESLQTRRPFFGAHLD